MDRRFDLVVIGTGAAAFSPAYRCRKAGWSVAVVDRRPYGGTCALRGCNPKKVLVGAAELADRVRRMAGKGLSAPGLRVDWPALMRFKRTFTEPVPERVERGFRREGIETLHGAARFTGPGTLEAGPDRLAARRVLIAAGSVPARLDFPGEELLAASDVFLELDELPRRIVFVGGGYISFELAHVAACAGAEAVILHRGARPLSGFDPDLVGRLVAASRGLGIEVVLEAPVEGVEGEPGRLAVRAGGAAGGRCFEADLAVHGAGRVADLEELDLETAGVRHGRKGVEVDAFLRSVSNPAVFAAGDSAASGAPQLTPVAGLEGEVAADNLLAGGPQAPGGPQPGGEGAPAGPQPGGGRPLRPVDYRGLPTVVFTVPALAAVGLGEAEARARGLDIRVTKGDSSGWFTTRHLGGGPAGWKLIFGREDGRLLGAHLLGAQAEEVINLFALAVRLGLGADDLKAMLWSYPSASYDLRYML